MVCLEREPGHGRADWQSGGRIDARVTFGSASTPCPPHPRRRNTRDAQVDLLVRQLPAAITGGSFTTNTVTTAIARIAAAKSALPASVRPAQMIEYRISVTNTGSAASSGTLVKDAIPAATSYVTGSTTLNGTAVADALGTSPLVLGMLVNSPGAGAGIVNFGEAADVRFIVRVDPSTTAAIVNTALIEPDGSAGLLPEFPASVTTPVTPTAEIALTNRAGHGDSRDRYHHVITLTNDRPANDVVLINRRRPGWRSRGELVTRRCRASWGSRTGWGLGLGEFRWLASVW
jgi:uncharacterized repeat protein (TIGR01451 family)